jgi:hypothetical protein
MKQMKRFFIAFFLVTTQQYTLPLLAQDAVSTSAPAVKTFALQGDISGLASNSVNLFSGDVAYPLNLISLPGHNGLDAGVSISYNSNVQHQTDLWNLEAANSILGLGWSLGTSKIICDNKQTGTREDDEYYLVDGGSSTMFIRTDNGVDAEGSYYVYETEKYQFWKIKFYYDLAEAGYNGSGPNKWVIIREDGSKYIYGDANSGRQTIQWMVRWENWVGNSAQTQGQSQFANVWNLSEISNRWNEKITFEYENIEQFVGSSAGKMQTEASYLKTVTDVWGRKISFVYNDKQLPYYTEPHTEQAEPDAFQEFYEKKYLDRINVMSETNNLILSVHFGYGSINDGTNKAKMLLTSVTQKNANSNSLPGMSFEYLQSGPTKGFLSRINYPTGGSVSYTYTEKTVGHSNRQFTAVAPAGYAEPKVWLGEDYAVVAWRQLGAGNTHDASALDVKLYAYQWVGEWEGQFLQTISGVLLEGDQYTKDYKDFQVTIQKDFFGVLARGIGDSYTLFARYKDIKNRGEWGYYTITADYGTGKPTLMSGDRFIAVGSSQDDGTHPSHLYTFKGNGFLDTELNQTIGEHFYAASNNYFISHNRAGFDGFPEINFNYLTEDRKWTTKSWGSWLEFSSTSPSYWYAANSMAVCMAGNNPEYAYRWDLTYTNFYRDTKDKLNADLFGGLYDLAPVFIMSNSMVGIYGRLARFDGKDWSTSNITSTNNGANPNGSFFSYGDDYVVRPITYLSSSGNYNGGRKVYNPNTLNWEADVVMSGADAGPDFASAGIDYYYFGNGYYYRQPNSVWNKVSTTANPAARWNRSGWPRLDVWHGIQYKTMQEIQYFKNGELKTTSGLFGRNVLFNPYKFKSNGVANQTVVTYSNIFNNVEDATSIILNRFVNDEVSGQQVDYPCTLITVNDGNINRVTSIDYNIATATIDPSGTTVQYNEVTEIPGSADANSKPFGYIKSFFFNGLTSIKLGSQTYFDVDLLWTGASYKKEVYNSAGLLKSSSTTTYSTTVKVLQNNTGQEIKTAWFARPITVKNKTDNIETEVNTSYDINTGLPVQTITTNFDSKGSALIVSYKYFWEQYDPGRSLNLLSPIIQVKKQVFGSSAQPYSDVSATTWKLWNNIYAPHKTYTWKRTGNPDFDFTNWSNTGEPTADWIKLSEINAVSTNGNIIQVTKQ